MSKHLNTVLNAAVSVADRLLGPRLEGVIRRLVLARVIRLEPREALCFLFGLDAFLYDLEGMQAVEYGGGVHPKHRHTRYHDFFVARVQPGWKVLDVGCGNGALAKDMAERAGAQVTGVDLCPQNIATAKARFSHPNVSYIQGDALTDLPRERFDAVILSNVLEHLQRRVEFLRNLVETTGAQAVLIRAPRFDREWRVPLKKELGVEWRLDATHETEYTWEQLEQEIVASGLRVVHSESCWGEFWVSAAPQTAAVR